MVAQEDRDFFRDLCDGADDLIQSVAPDGRFLYANKAWHHILGYTARDLERIRLFDVIHPSCWEHCAAALKKLAAGEPSVHIEAVFKAKDGHKVDVEGTASCRFENGKPVSTRGIFRDVTERNRASDQLERLFNLSLDLLCVAGVDGYFKLINPAFERVLGYSGEELLSRRFVEFVHPDDREATEVEIQRLAEGHPVVDFENRYLAANGEYRWLAWRSAPIQDRGLVYAVARDVTESKKMERLLKHQARELERSNSDLEQFAYAASHDLRAPMRAMANLADWIEEDLPGGAPEKVRGHVDKLRERLARLDDLTTSILEYSKVGHEKEGIRKVDTALLVSDLAAEISPPKGFKVAPDFSLPSFETARTPFEQVLRNLIGNAVVHAGRPEGRATVSAVELDDMYEFRVADDGPGVPPEEREKIFEMFHRLRAGDGPRGAGMGLALVKRIVERHGGSIRVEPADPHGSVFIFTWPKKLPFDGPQNAEDPDRR